MQGVRGCRGDLSVGTRRPQPKRGMNRIVVRVNGVMQSARVFRILQQNVFADGGSLHVDTSVSSLMARAEQSERIEGGRFTIVRIIYVQAAHRICVGEVAVLLAPSAEQD